MAALPSRMVSSRDPVNSGGFPSKDGMLPADVTVVVKRGAFSGFCLAALRTGRISGSLVLWLLRFGFGSLLPFLLRTLSKPHALTVAVPSVATMYFLPWTKLSTLFFPSLALYYIFLLAMVFVFLAGAMARLRGRALAVCDSPHSLPSQPETSRPLGAAFWKDKLFTDRIDGIVVITGATGHVGSGLLFALLAQSEKLGVSRVVLLMRPKYGIRVEERLARLRQDSAFDEVRDKFDDIVSVLQGDCAKENLGIPRTVESWPYSEPPFVVIHCASGAEFNQSLQHAAVNVVTSTLQMARLAVHWKSKRFICLSSAFVHPRSSPAMVLEQTLVNFHEYEPEELYRDAINDGQWAASVMKDLGFLGATAFMQAIAEHLVIRMCNAADNIDVAVVRCPLIGPAWASPFACWCGRKPHMLVHAVALAARFDACVFRLSLSPAPVMPVDLIVDTILDVVMNDVSDSGIYHGVVGASESDKMWSSQELAEIGCRFYMLSGFARASFCRLFLRLCKLAERPIAFKILNFVFTVLLARIRACFRRRHMEELPSCAQIPMLLEIFTSSDHPWLFRSHRPMPQNWDRLEYARVVLVSALCFAQSDLERGPSPSSWNAMRRIDKSDTLPQESTDRSNQSSSGQSSLATDAFLLGAAEHANTDLVRPLWPNAQLKQATSANSVHAQQSGDQHLHSEAMEHVVRDSSKDLSSSLILDLDSLSDAAVDEQFNLGIELMKSRLQDVNHGIPDFVLLEAYAPYKQAMFGDARGSQPWAVKVRERAKWDAWNKLKGMSKTDAMKLYLRTVVRIQADYPTSSNSQEHSLTENIATATRMGNVHTSSSSNDVDTDSAGQDDLEARFNKAIESLTSITQYPNHGISNGLLLEVYAHYKQVKLGDVQGSRPWAVQARDRAKWDAWNQLKGMNKGDAMLQYCQLVSKIQADK